MSPVTEYRHCFSRDDQVKQELTDEQYRIMRCNGTEAPFSNQYWDNKQAGIYVDRLSGVPLFSSLTKYDSGTGWPSFFAPLNDFELLQIEDCSHGLRRVEVRSRSSDSHLGHLFPDGPEPTGLRYCINSAALRFIALADLKRYGYGDYRELFKNIRG